MDWIAILTWICSNVLTGAGAWWIANKKAGSEAKVASAQVEKIKSDITLEWLKELQDQLGDMRESNDLKSQKIEQLEAIIRTKRLPNPE